MKFRLIFVIFIAFFLSCTNTKQNYGVSPYSSYREIPGVTSAEITAIESIKEQLAAKGINSFTYGMMPSTEAFLDARGDIRGYSTHFCEWLTEIFGISFLPKHYTWMSLLEGLESGEIDFTGDLAANLERRKTYIMSDAITQRSLKYYIITGREHPAEIAQRRMPRILLRENTVTALNVLYYAGGASYDESNDATYELSRGTFEPIYISEYDEAYALLLSGAADALVAENSQEAIFDKYSDIEAIEFFPFIFTPASFSTQNPIYTPFISVVQKALENDKNHYFNDLYDQGYHEYLKHKLYMRLDREELLYILNNPVIPFAAEYDNYPTSFFNTRYKEWRGVCFDTLKQIEALTGLKFNIVNNEKMVFHELFQLLESGKAYMISELIHTPDREGKFLWPENSFMTDQSVLISEFDHININIDRIYSQRIGLSKGVAHTEFFLNWFPNHPHTIIYDNRSVAFNALMNKEVDMVMNSYSTLLDLTNYRELAGFKANLIFDNNFKSTFGVNKDQTVLCSIIDKALDLIDTKTISEQWRYRTYDYRLKIAEARTPWLLGSAGLFLCVLVLLAVFFYRSRRAGKELERLVEKRTHELAQQKTKLEEKTREQEQDITKRKELEAAALAASHSKSAFLANMSHEIRTPMNAILGVTELLIQHTALPDDIEEGLDKIYSSCEMLLGIINDILDFSKIEAGKMDISPDQYKVASMINDSVHLNMMRINSKPIEFELQINDNVPANLIGDELRIKQILNNLLSNAFKYTDSGRVTLSVDFETLSKEEVMLILEVRDSGRGMSKEQMDKMYEEYARFNNEKNTAVEGTGLGLVITRRLINMMNGEIKVKSKPGKGSTFTIKLPQKITDSQVLGKAVVANLKKFRFSFLKNRKRSQFVRDPMPYGRVLIVDDVETNLYVAVGLMKLYRLHIDTAIKGQDAIDKIQGGNTYDIIFMDHMMPEMDGIETTKRLRDIGYNAPIVALTANAVAGQADMFLQNGFDEFIAKPIDIRQLNSILNKLIRDKQPASVIEAARENSPHFAREASLQIARVTALEEEQKQPGDQSGPVCSAEAASETEAEAAGEWFLKKEIYGLDIARGLERYDGDEKIYLKLLHSYAANVSTMLSEIETVSAETLENYRIKVHGIKGISLDIFAQQIGSEAKALEDAAKENNLDLIKEKNPIFIESARKLVKDITDLVSSVEAEDKKPKKDKPDRESLLKLLTACKKYNIDKADEAMEEIEKYQYESDDGLANFLRESIDRMDYTQIVKKLSA